MIASELNGFNIDLGKSKSSKSLVFEELDFKLEIPQNLFKLFFFSQRKEFFFFLEWTDEIQILEHINFVENKNSGQEYSIISVLRNPQYEVHKALRINKQGYESFLIEAKIIGKRGNVSKKILKYLSSQQNSCKYELVKNPQFSEEICALEEKHPFDNFKKFKAAIIPAREGQQFMQEIFRNSNSNFNFFILFIVFLYSRTFKRIWSFSLYFRKKGRFIKLEKVQRRYDW